MLLRLAAALPLLAAALLAPPSAGRAQESAARPPGVGIRVVDAADAPISGTRVVVGAGAEGMSDESGWVRLPGVQPGRTSVLVTRIGYRPAEFSVEVPAGGGLEVDVELEPAPVSVEGVTAVGRTGSRSLAAGGFHRRRERGMGSFLTRDDIARTRARRTSEVFRHVRGIRVVSAGTNTYRLQTARYGLSLSQRSSAGGLAGTGVQSNGGAVNIVCEMLVYLDGAMVQLAGIDDVGVDSLEAIEVYRGAGEIPAEFRVTNAGCGVVLLWTRTSG